MTIKTLHRWNAMFLGVFIVLHMATHLSGVFGVQAYNNTQSLLRYVYRNPVVEPFVLLSIFLQIGWGVVLLIGQIRRGLRGPWARTQVISGGVFLFFITEHLIALVLARWIDGLDTNFYWPASVMSGAPFTWYFFPYYILGVSALFIHIGCAIRLTMMRGAYRHYATVSFWGLTMSGLTIALIINLTLLGVFYEIQLPDEWITYLRRFVAGYSQ